MKFMTEEGEVSEAILDGYGIGDRQLEGVRFVFTIVEDELKVRVHPDDVDYFTQFNQEYWYNEALEYAQSSSDVLGTALGEYDVWIED
jgi:hypothetical protein